MDLKKRPVVFLSFFEALEFYLNFASLLGEFVQ